MLTRTPATHQNNPLMQNLAMRWEHRNVPGMLTTNSQECLNKQQIIKIACDNKIPIAEASKILSNPSPGRPLSLSPLLPRVQSPPIDANKELEDTRKKSKALNHRSVPYLPQQQDNNPGDHR